MVYFKVKIQSTDLCGEKFTFPTGCCQVLAGSVRLILQNPAPSPAATPARGDVPWPSLQRNRDVISAGITGVMHVRGSSALLSPGISRHAEGTD